jgi:hypothetical protein
MQFLEWKSSRPISSWDTIAAAALLQSPKVIAKPSAIT